MIRGIIFDLDGVICFTDRYHYIAWKELADEIGVYFDEQINNRLRGVSRMDCLEIMLERSDKVYSQEEKEQLTDKKNSTFVELLKNMSPKDLSEEVLSTLTELKRREYKLAIGSSSKNTMTILRQIGLGDFFDAVSDGNNIEHSKPHPQVFLMAADMLGLPPAECIVVEDAIAGIDAAVAGGFVSVGIGEASGHPEVSYPITTFSQMLEIAKPINP